MEHSAEYYKQLAEAREFDLDTILQPSIEILTVRGIVYSMLADVTLYGSKAGKNEKYKESMDKLMQIENFLDKCNTVNDRNMQLRRLLKTSMLERDKLENIIIAKDKELEAIQKAFNRD